MKNKGFLKKEKGFTLVELAVVIPLIAIIFIISYNMIFITNKSFKNTKENFSTSEEIRIFLINIKREVNGAKKSTDDKDAIYTNGSDELYIYSDIDNDEKPELIKYYLDNGQIKKNISKAKNDKYPYEYDEFIKDTVVLNNVLNTDIFGKVEMVKEPEGNLLYETKDYRRKVIMKLELDKGKKEPSIIKCYLISKSRTEAK